MTIVETADGAVAASSGNPRRKAIAGIGRRLRDRDFGTGALASLRRNGPGVVVGQPAFHRLFADLPDDLLDGIDAPIRWASVVQASALTAVPGTRPPDLHCGIAFARAGLSEARLSRLLASADEALRDQLAMAARRLAAQQIDCDWRDAGELVLVEGFAEARAETLRFRIARAYWRELAAIDRKR